MHKVNTNNNDEKKYGQLNCVHANIIIIIVINTIGNNWPSVDIYLKRINHFNFILYAKSEKKNRSEKWYGVYGKIWKDKKRHGSKRLVNIIFTGQ